MRASLQLNHPNFAQMGFNSYYNIMITINSFDSY